MRIWLLSSCWLLVVSVSPSARADAFVNLDFELGLPAEGDSGVPVGWLGSMPSRGSLCVEAGCGVVVGPDYLGTALAGQYSVILNADSGLFGEAYLQQQGMVPAFAKSLRILVANWTYSKYGITDGWRNGDISATQALNISLNGQLIPFVEVGHVGDMTVIAGDISAFAGQPAELLVQATASKIPTSSLTVDPIIYLESALVGGGVDNLEFSPLAVPEPTSTWLAIASVAMCGAPMRRQRDGVRTLTGQS